jgi:hypothetical protein
MPKADETRVKKRAKNYKLAGNALLIKNREEWLLHPFPGERPVLIKQYHEIMFRCCLQLVQKML